MRSIIVLSHPETASFNAHMARLAQATLAAGGNSAELLDLHRLSFDPLERGAHFTNPVDPTRFDAQAEQRHASDTDTLPRDVRAHLEALDQADLLILQFPMWWHSLPAMLKGWIDRVFVYGRAYTSKRRYDTGVFRGKRAMLSLTTGGPEGTFQYNGRNGDIDHLLWPHHYTLHYLGFTVLAPFIAFGVEGALRYSPEGVMAQRLKTYETQYGEQLRAIDTRATIPFNGWSDWDAEGKLKPEAKDYSPFMRQKR